MAPSEHAVKRRTEFSRRLNQALTYGWLAATPVVYYVGWLDSIRFVSFLSLYAIVITHMAAWRADENPQTDQIDRIEAKVDAA